MTSANRPPEKAAAKTGRSWTGRKRSRSQAAALLARGEPMLWLTSGAMWICLLMIVGLLALVVWHGAATFWPSPVVHIQTLDGRAIQGEVTRHEEHNLSAARYASLHPAMRERLRDRFAKGLDVPPGRYLTGQSVQTVRDSLDPEDAASAEALRWLNQLDPLALPSGAVYFRIDGDMPASMPEPQRDQLETRRMNREDVLDAEVPRDRTAPSTRRLVRIGNYEITGEHFVWVDDFEIEQEGNPDWALVLERQTWGRFYGVPVAFTIDGQRVAETSEAAWQAFGEHHGPVRRRWRERRDLEQGEMGDINEGMDKARLAVREVELEHGKNSQQHQRALREQAETERWAKSQYERIGKKIAALNEENARYQIVMRVAGGREVPLAVEDIVRAYPANQLGLVEKINVYGARWWEFLSDVPREANSEGGVFPAIFGTAVMTLLMSLAVVPFGVLAALYLREYATAGPIISAVRIAINNLAGVPSIVFGVFGLGFFCYGVGSFIDGGPASSWTTGNWMLGGGVLAATVVAAIAAGVFLPRRANARSGPQKLLGWVISLLWIAAVATAVLLVVKTPYFQGFYQAKLPNPTFGKGALVWASFTLALLTLPVVIVATEEALAAVPRSMREGSYACGGSKWQTIRRIVLPRAMPGIMTGMILAMARGAGEVAPLMLVGAVKLAPELPIAAEWPFGVDRSFMHLGFHIYDLGFQSQNSEAAKPMVYTTTLLLILMIALMNLTAIWLRGRLRKKFITSQF
jgi:ABC-type phosphate transport system permease subunit/ABC-type phosphate transport system auxiliary subunit